jgi:hypothetical protein
MARITLVAQLLAVLGGEARSIGAALTRNAPLVDEELADEADAAQVARLSALLNVLDGAAARLEVTLDSLPLAPRQLIEEIDNAGRMLARRAAAGPAA